MKKVCRLCPLVALCLVQGDGARVQEVHLGEVLQCRPVPGSRPQLRTVAFRIPDKWAQEIREASERRWVAR